MNNNINLVEILKDCPQAIELYSPICGECTFEGVDNDSKYPIIVCATDGTPFCFTANGRYFCNLDAECLLFPSKDQRDWSKFQKLFKDGDIVVNASNEYSNAFIYAGENNLYYECYVGLTTGINPELSTDKSLSWVSKKSGIRFATEEEKEKLFQAIKNNGYKWNAETKTLEKLIKPKFKVGDRIKYKNGRDINGAEEGIILSITDDTYDVAVTNELGISIPIEEEYKLELIPNKFDITTLKPFESKVLVRNRCTDVWVPAIFGIFYTKAAAFKFCVVGGGRFEKCIPYKGNEHLLNTTDDCDNYYKN